MHASFFQSVFVLIASSVEAQLGNSLDLFSEYLDEPSSELDWIQSPDLDPIDDNVNIFDDASEVPLTDTVLISDCDTQQQSLIDDGGLSLFGRDSAACSSTSQPPLNQPPLPLSPETLQLFQDPSSLEGLLQDSLPTIPKKYPGLLSPGEQREREWIDDVYHDMSDMDGESWKTFEGDTHPCGRFRRPGLMYPVCCDGPGESFSDLSSESVVLYTKVQNCDLLVRTY